MEYAIQSRRKDILGTGDRICKSIEISQSTQRTGVVTRLRGALWRVWLLGNLRDKQEPEHGDHECILSIVA
jgi:hypothetical protein